MILEYDLIAGRIDHALLLPTLTPSEVEAGCRLADTYGVASVCVKPTDVALAARVLHGSLVKVGTVIGFPHGGQATAVKLFESRMAIDAGAVELDMVINIGWAREGLWGEIAEEIRSIVDLAHATPATFDQTLQLAGRNTGVMVSHTGCRALHDTQRNVDDGQLHRIGARGGVVGIMAHPLSLGCLWRADRAGARSATCGCDHPHSAARRRSTHARAISGASPPLVFG